MATASMRVGQTRVLLADTQPQVRSALRILMDLEAGFVIVGEAVEAREMLAQIRATRPDLVLLDWGLPGLSAVGSISAVRSLFPDIKIIALSSHLEAGWEALAAGADVFISKVDPPDHLLAALRTINSKEDGGLDHLDIGGGQ
jgi:DNA-binding NarL/FixJ family response regulator